MEARYVDEFLRRTGRWRIQDRRVVSDLALRHTAEILSAGRPEWTGPRRDRHDYYYVKRTLLRSASSPAARVPPRD
jgi:hypothetical protein